MKKTKITTKALSVLLTVIMLFTTISVGLVIPEADLTASAAEVIQKDCYKFLDIEDAIVASNGDTSNVYKIVLKDDITTDTSNAPGGYAFEKFPEIKGNIIFDFAGFDISFQYHKSADYSSNQFDCQIPKENAVDGVWHTTSDSLSNAVFTVAKNATFQIINSKGEHASSMIVSTEVKNTSNGDHTSHQTSSNLINCQGTLILGDDSTDTKSNFTLSSYSGAINSNEDSGWTNSKNGANASAFTININGTDAVFKMYGGSVEASGNVTFRREDTSFLVVIALNVKNCKSAEIYGGHVNVTSANVRNTRGDNPTEDNRYIATAIRSETSNLYIFDVSSKVNGRTGTDTSRNDNLNLYLTNIDSINSDNPVHFYGGHLELSGVRGGSESANIQGALIRGAFKVAGRYKDANGTEQTDGGISPSSAYGTNYGVATDTKADSSATTTASSYVYSNLIFADAVSRNGVNPDNFGTFAEYIKGSSSDFYYRGGQSFTYLDVNTNGTGATGGYLRNGYAHTGWQGKTHPGQAYSTEIKDTQTAGLNASKGGTVFLTPAWTANEYPINYVLGGTSEFPVANENTLKNNHATYKIDDADNAVPIPVRHGYTFKGWTVSETDRWPTDDAFGWGSVAGTGEVYSTFGKFGKVTLTAKWEANRYSVDVYTDKGNTKYTVNYSGGDILATTPIRPNGGLTHYVYNGYYEILRTSANTNWPLNTKIYILDENKDGVIDNDINEQFYGKFGDIAELRASYTPVEYDIVYFTDNKDNVPDTPVLADPDKHFTYNVEDGNKDGKQKELSPYKPSGEKFNGWEVVWTDGNWTIGEIVKAIPNDGTPRYGTVHFKANCDPRDYTINIELADDETFPTNDREYGYRFSNSLTISEIPSRDGYDFNGWRVKSAQKVNEDDVVNWPVGELVGELVGGSLNSPVRIPSEFVGNVTLVADWVPHPYKITFNGNNADQGNDLGIKDYHIGSTADVPFVSRNGYVFMGWKPEKTSGTWVETEKYFIDKETVLDGFWGDVTLVAQWEQDSYDVSFDLNGGTGDSATLTYKTESSLELHRNPVRTGYVFDGWEIESCEGNWSEYKADVEANGGVVTGSIPSGYYGNISLKAKWTAIEYTIQLKVNNNIAETIRYYVNEAVILPEKTAPGQDFVTWKLSESKDGWSSGHYDAGREIAAGKYGNIVLEAVLSAKPYRLTFVEAVKGSDELVQIPGLGERTYYFTKEFDLPELVKNGYTFVGWEVVSEFGADSEYGGWRNGDVFNVEPGSGKTTISANRYYGDVTLKAVYTIAENNVYNITFNTNGGNPVADIEYNTESDRTLPLPEKTGYIFNGWIRLSYDGNWTQGKYSAGEPLEGKYGNVSFLADWTPRNYTITWKIGDEEYTSEFAYGTTPVCSYPTVKIPDAQYTYSFNGWYPAIEPVTGDATYEAQYKSTLRSYKVIWEYQTEAEGAYSKKEVTYKYGEHPIFNNGQNPTIVAPDNEYWTFRGWKVKDSAPEIFIDDETIVTGSVTYVAVFEKIEAPVKIIWSVQGVEYVTYWEKHTAEKPSYPSYPGSLILPDENGRSYRITGWQIKTSTGDVTINEIPAATEDAIYYAKIQGTPKLYDAFFDFNGGKYSGSSTVTYDVHNGLAMPQPEKAGYKFGGWIVTESDSTKWTVNTLYPESLYRGNWGDVSFKAHWIVESYKVTVKTDSGTTDFSYNIEEEKYFPEIEKDGYDLTGWIIENASAGSNWMMGDTIAADKSLKGMYGDITVSPVWTAKSFTISWISGDSIREESVRFGDPVFTYAPVAKDGYTAKWDKEIPSVMPAENLEINAVYSPIQYYLKLNANGGTLTDGKPVKSDYYSIISTNLLPELKREGADFAGWRVSAANGSWIIGNVIEAGTALAGNYGNVTLTAVWTFHIYEITWVVGNTEKVTRWYYGAEPSYDGTPYKPSDDNWSYKFTGMWKGEDGKSYNGTEIPTVTGNAKYTAEFDRTLREYVIKWDVNGYVISQTYSFGETVKCPYTESNPPSRPSTDEYDFTFLGWSPEVSAIVTGDVTYVAMFDVYTKIQGLRTDKTAVFIDIDDSVNINAIISPSTATSKDVEWVSLNQNIATVNEDGKVIGVSAGETLVRVQSKDGKFRAYCFVNVAPVITDYIVVSAAGISTTRLPGEAVQLYATIMPENASNKIVKWTTSDAQVATVDANGLVMFGNKVGSAVITATSDGYATGSITVTTTTDKSVIKDNVKTYVVMFNASSSSYIIAGQTYESINIICKEGDTIEFLLTEPHFVTLNATQFERDTDGVYRIKNIDSNYNVIASERPDLGFEEEPEEPENNGTVKLSFFDRLKAFFRSIVEFFRGLFGG